MARKILVKVEFIMMVLSYLNIMKKETPPLINGGVSINKNNFIASYFLIKRCVLTVLLSNTLRI